MKRALLAIALLVAPSLVFAQAETTGRITGTVLDENQQPIKGADVTIESPALQGQRKSTSDDNGHFLVSLLPGGVYTMTVNAPGKSPLQYTFRVGVGQTVPIDAVLKSGNMSENVTVFAPAAKMQTTAGGENFNLESTIKQLPVATGGDYLGRIATLAPNVSEVTFTANTLSISGASSFDNNVMLDGAEISDPFYSSGTTVYLEEAVEEVQIITNGASARYGRFQGGVVNATTKSGSNKFDGSVRVDFKKQTWNQKTPFGENQSDNLDKIYSGVFGGPIMKDHLWFFLGGRKIPESTATHSVLFPGVSPTSFETTNNETRYQIKLTGAISANHTLDVSYLNFDGEAKNYDPFSWVAEPNAIIPVRKDPRKFYTAEYNGVLTDKMFLGVQFAQKKVSIQSGGDPSKPSPILEYYNGEYRAYANGWFDPNDPSVRDNKSASINMTHSLTTGSWGDHTLEYGVQYVDSITAGDNRQSPTGYNLYLATPTGANSVSFADCDPAGNCTFDMDPSLWFYERLKAIPGAGEQSMKNYALYVQDGWEYRNWRVDLGLRWEKWKGDAISPAMTLDFNEVSPRIGVTYNITPEWQIQGTWGKYVSRFNDGVANGVTGISSIYGPGILQEYGGPVLLDQTPAQVDALLRDDANWTTILGFVDPRQPSTFFADNIKAPYANDLNVSVKRALPKNTGVVTLTYSKREFKNLLDDFKGDNGVTTVTPPGGPSQDVDTVIWRNCDTCKRDYEALAAVLDFRPSAKWNIGGNYTYAKTRGNYEGEAAGQPAIGSIIGNYPRNVVPSAAYPYGYLAGDIRHRVRVWGNYRFDFGRAGRFTIGGIGSYRSGASFSKVASVDAGADPAPDYSGAPSRYVAFFDGRGNNRFNGAWALDAAFRYDISFWKDVGMMFKFDIANVTNQNNMISYRTGGSAQDTGSGVLQWVPSATFGTPSSERNFQTPRSYFVAVGVNF